MHKISLEEAKKILDQDKLIICPTDTLYALTCNATKESAIKALLTIKRRDKNKPLPIICSSFKQVEEYCYFNDFSFDIAQKYWPGPITLILKSRKHLPPILTNGKNEIAVRWADCSFTNYLAKDYPIVATSANISGETNIYNPAHFNDFFDIPVLNNGILPDNTKPSTIVDTLRRKVIREGAIKIEKILD